MILYIMTVGSLNFYDGNNTIRRCSSINDGINMLENESTYVSIYDRPEDIK